MIRDCIFGDAYRFQVERKKRNTVGIVPMHFSWLKYLDAPRVLISVIVASRSLPIEMRWQYSPYFY